MNQGIKSDNVKRKNRRYWIFVVVGIAAVLIITIFAVGSKIVDYKEWANFVTVHTLAVFAFAMTIITVLTSRETLGIMENQESEMILQRQAMEEQLTAMKIQLDQNEKIFYASERAYIGIAKIEILSGDTVLLNSLPDSGRLQINLQVLNKGNTPASNFAHAYRVGVLSPNNLTEPDEGSFGDPKRHINEILPEDVRFLTSDEFAISPEEIAAVKADEAYFVITVRIDFTCVGDRQETYITHFLWSTQRMQFSQRRDWPFTE